jgi:uncharacterized protein YcfL
LKKAILVALAALALAGCGTSNDKTKGGYPQEAVDNFTTACIKTAGGSQEAKTRCNCVIDKLQSSLSYNEFKAADSAYRNDPSKLDPNSKKKIDQATSDCRKEG